MAGLDSTALPTVYKQITTHLGRGGGQVVSVLAFYSDDLSSNPPEAYSVFL